MNVLKFLPRNSKPRTGLTQGELLDRIEEDLRTTVGRKRFMGEALQVGPNWVHASIRRGDSGIHGAPGTYEDLGWAHNYRPDAGMDWIHNMMGGISVPTTNSPATSIGATSVTGTGTTLTTDALKGFLIIMPVTGLTTKPVHGHILSNSTSVIQVGAWHNEDCSTGTTPAGTSAYILTPGQGPAKFIGLTNDNTSHPNEVGAATTALTSEITANGLGRALATFAHTATAETYTLTKQWTATGAQSVHRAGNFTGDYGASGGGIMVAGTDLNADATLATNDTLQVVWTWTLPNQGA